MSLIGSPVELKRRKQELQEKEASRQSEVIVTIKVAMATCGIASGARTIYDYFTEELEKRNIEAEVIPTGCMGYCYAEPTIEVTLNGGEPVVFGNVDERKADEVIEKYIKKREMPEGVIPAGFQSVDLKQPLAQEKHDGPKQLRIALRNCGKINPGRIDDYILHEGYQALAQILTNMKPEDAIEELIQSGLRGRGGGGFPTGLKWRIAAKNLSDQKYVVCNADEGDPGAFMDRSVLEGDPHSVIEAMAICGYCIGADQGLVYIRAEYPLAIERLKTAIDQARTNGLLGKQIMGTSFCFDIELKYGAGAFVCGEETALIHSMEGHRGEPTVKPPFPAESGYLNKPTNVNNVETFACIPPIFLKGPEWFKQIGTDKSKGTKVFSLAGKINKVGLIEVPMGTRLKDVIYEIGGGIQNDKAFKAVQTGGPSGGCLTEKHLDTPIDYDNLIQAGSMMGSGGMIVMDEDDCMVSVAKFYLDFTVEESCGKCSPCRIGNKRLHEILEKITEGKGTMEDLENLRNLGNVIKETALCGLGQTSPNPVLSTLDNFWDEYVEHVVDKKCRAGVCKAMMQYVIDEEQCVGCMACARNCPVNAISGEKKMPHRIEQSICIKCGACMERCKFNAVLIS